MEHFPVYFENNMYFSEYYEHVVFFSTCVYKIPQRPPGPTGHLGGVFRGMCVQNVLNKYHIYQEFENIYTCSQEVEHAHKKKLYIHQICIFPNDTSARPKTVFVPHSF